MGLDSSGNMHTIDIPTLVVGASSLALILLMKRFTPKLPNYLIVVGLAAFVVSYMHLPVETIGTRFPDTPSGLPMPSFPEMSLEKLQEVLPLAFTIAFLAGIEALLSAVVADSMTGFKHRPNQELVAHGLGNIGASLFGGLPATGALARTATNVKAGAKTPVAGLFNALFVLLFVLFATDYMAYVPMTALAAILFMVAWGMSEVHQFIRIFKLSAQDRLLLLLTFSLTILVDLTIAIGLGVTAAALLFMREMSKSVGISAENPGLMKTNGDALRDKEEKDDAPLPKHVEVLRISGPLFFAVAGDIFDYFRAIGDKPKVLIVDMSLVPYLDGTGARTLVTLLHDCQKKGCKVILSGLQDQPTIILDSAGLNPQSKGVLFTQHYKEAVNQASKLSQVIEQ